MTQLPAEAREAITARKERWNAFYDPNRPPTSMFLIRCWNELGERPFPRMDNIAERIDYTWRKYNLMLDQLAWLDDDSLPYMDLYTGTEIFAAAFGCQVYYPENDMPFAMPRVHSAEEAAEIEVPSLHAPATDVLFMMADEMRRRAGECALMRMVDLQSPMDIAALIWDKVTFYPAMIDQPEAVFSLAYQVRTFLTQFLDEWFSRYGKGYIAHYPDYYVPYGVTLSEDEIGAVSGRMFDQFFLPELVELSSRYGSLGMHCCANARHQWGHFDKIPNLRMLNLVQPPEVTREAWTFFADKVPQYHAYMGEGPAWTWPAQHPPEARMVYEIWVDSQEEALETSAKMRAAIKKHQPEK